MSTIQAIAKLMEMAKDHSDYLEALIVLTKRLAEKDEEVADLKKLNDYHQSLLAEAKKRSDGGGR